MSVDGRGRLGYRSWRSPVRWVIGSCALAEAFLDHVLAAAAADQQLVRALADPYAGLVRSRCRERGSSFSDVRRQDLLSRGYLGRCTVSSLLFWTGGVLDLSRVSGGSFSVSRSAALSARDVLCFHAPSQSPLTGGVLCSTAQSRFPDRGTYVRQQTHEPLFQDDVSRYTRSLVEDMARCQRFASSACRPLALARDENHCRRRLRQSPL